MIKAAYTKKWKEAEMNGDEATASRFTRFLFYEAPRFVTHIDDPAIAALTKYYSKEPGIKESDTGLAAPSQWDLVSDKQMMQEEQPLQIEDPKIEDLVKPRHRFMSSYEGCNRLIKDISISCLQLNHPMPSPTKMQLVWSSRGRG